MEFSSMSVSGCRRGVVGSCDLLHSSSRMFYPSQFGISYEVLKEGYKQKHCQPLLKYRSCLLSVILDAINWFESLQLFFEPFLYFWAISGPLYVQGQFNINKYSAEQRLSGDITFTHPFSVPPQHTHTEKLSK